MKVLNFNNSVIISTITYYLTSLIGIVLYLQIFTLFDLNTLGKFSVYQTVVFLGSKFISLSTPFSLMRFVSQEERTRINLNYFISAICIVLFFFICGYGLYNIEILFKFFIKVPYSEVVVLLSKTILLQAINFLIKSFFNSFKDFIYYNISFLLRPLLTIFIIYFFYKELFSDFYLVFFYTELLLIIFNSFLLLSRMKFFYLSNMIEAFLSHLQYMKTAFLTSVFTEIYFKVDIFCIAVLLGEYYSGIYALVAIIGEGLVGLIYVIRNNLTPYITIKNIEEKNLHFRTHILASLKSANLVSFITSFFIILVVIFGSKRVDLLNTLYIEGFQPLLIVLIGFSVMSFFLTIENVLLQIGSHGQHVTGLIIFNFLNIFLNFALVEYKLIGIVIATVLSYFIFINFVMIVFKIKFKYSLLTFILSN